MQKTSLIGLIALATVCCGCASAPGIIDEDSKAQEASDKRFAEPERADVPTSAASLDEVLRVGMTLEQACAALDKWEPMGMFGFTLLETTWVGKSSRFPGKVIYLEFTRQNLHRWHSTDEVENIPPEADAL